MSEPIILAILDGWGLSPTWKGNAIAQSNPPAMDRLWHEYPHTVLEAYQPFRQSARRQIGNSEISHAMIGAGRTLESDLEEILRAIDQKLFEDNIELVDAMRVALQTGRPIHLVGLASNGGIHSDLKVLEALLALAARYQIKDVFLHLITDGQDTPPTSGVGFIEQVVEMTTKIGCGTIASLVGRSYAMDRGGHWDRTLVAYKLWTEGVGTEIGSADEAFRRAYENNLSDATLPPFLLKHSRETTMQNQDVVIFWNARADRLRQMLQAFVDPDALRPVFTRQAPVRKLAKCISLISPRMKKLLSVDIAFPPAVIRSTLPEIISNRRLTQLRAAETEKYAHVTYFFSGGREEPFPGEQRLILPSSDKLSDLRTKPAMQTKELTIQLLDLMTRQQPTFTLVNFANVDMVSHTGDLFATIEAVKIADRAIGRLSKFVEEHGGTLIITADHGNAEQMLDLTSHDHPDRTHTVNPVPFILVNQRYKRDIIKQAVTRPASMLSELMNFHGTLADVAPTILELLSIPIPAEMTGHSLLNQIIRT